MLLSGFSLLHALTASSEEPCCSSLAFLCSFNEHVLFIVGFNGVRMICDYLCLPSIALQVCCIIGRPTKSSKCS